ncbi:MAG: SH3 domain-containing protein, partial [Bacteroidota bacterium]|nr:SH3 domain-containing protein [Bacteroidota bacterium]
MKKITLILFIAMSLFACNRNKDNSNDLEDSNNQNISTQKNTEQFLFIEGNQIWIRKTPSTGKVIMKLNDGTKCKLLKKGKKETIKGITDYWYKIKYKEKKGWVFGS